jgi:hypothetical protein
VLHVRVGLETTLVMLDVVTPVQTPPRFCCLSTRVASFITSSRKMYGCN